MRQSVVASEHNPAKSRCSERVAIPCSGKRNSLSVFDRAADSVPELVLGCISLGCSADRIAKRVRRVRRKAGKFPTARRENVFDPDFVDTFTTSPPDARPYVHRVAGDHCGLCHGIQRKPARPHRP